MGFIETLTKHCKKIPLNKTSLYQRIEKEKKNLESNGFKIKIKDEFDMFDIELILNGFITKNKIDEAYQMFLNENYDILNYLNYEEKRKMFNHDIESLLNTLPSFYDQKSNTQIYIPFLEPFINRRYIEDYAVLMLKQHNDYVKNYKAHIHSATKLYGNGIYRTDFSSLKIVYEDDRHVCLYFDQLYMIYIFKKDTLELLNKFCFIDDQYNLEVNIEDVKRITEMIESYQYIDCLNHLRNKDFISDKTYNKIYKKYK